MLLQAPSHARTKSAIILCTMRAAINIFPVKRFSLPNVQSTGYLRGVAKRGKKEAMAITKHFSFVTTQSDLDISTAHQIRREVFADEQGIPAELDADGFDEQAFHVLCRTEGKAVATGRLVIADNQQGVLSRIAVRAPYRGHGLGRQIVQRLESAAIDQGLSILSLQPHLHLKAFYQGLGYSAVPGTDSVAGHILITMRKQIVSRPR